jgi:hypothetical protein
MSINEPSKDEAQVQFEQHLREFRPAAPQALALPSRRAPWGALAVAAAILVIFTAPAMLNHYKRKSTVPLARAPRTAAPRPLVAASITMGKLNVALRASDRGLDQALDDANSRLLPRMHPGTALFELGKE